MPKYWSNTFGIFFAKNKKSSKQIVNDIAKDIFCKISKKEIKFAKKLPWIFYHKILPTKPFSAIFGNFDKFQPSPIAPTTTRHHFQATTWIFGIPCDLLAQLSQQNGRVHSLFSTFPIRLLSWVFWVWNRMTAVGNPRIFVTLLFYSRIIIAWIGVTILKKLFCHYGTWTTLLKLLAISVIHYAKTTNFRIANHI